MTVTALDILCNDWDLTGEYINQIKSFMKGVNWDEGRDIRVKAMGVAESYIKETGDKECLKYLLEIFENVHEAKFIRETAYYCLCRALGEDYKEIRRGINLDDFPQNQRAQENIARIRQYLEK